MTHTCLEVYIHVVLASKGKFILSPLIENRLHRYLNSLAEQQASLIRKMSWAHDHMHLLVKLPSHLCAHVFVEDLKDLIKKYLQKEGYAEFAWEEGYGAFSCSLNHLQALSDYIGKQKEHHQIITFYHEMHTLTKAWGVKWDLNFPP